ncbi:DUF885 domain-containing protein [Ferrimonas lipolytica]|uniref:DUF885 domain-containing protein n=1 Tax=Ferrimonas lipolytica TaxID=2724191 RepID=A0A6H1UJ81_9GAMM|nr:DUF885 domain-containing protein [Ferrimonas lipolytica]QIZ78276.1 DUF885 domain-containing protein [Ferrimonas lipolytica]
MRVALLLLTALLCSCANSPAPQYQVEQLLDDSWQLQLASQPTLAQRYGNVAAASQLANLSPENLSAIATKQQLLLDQANAIDVAQLNLEQQANLAIVKHQLQNGVDSYRYHEHYRPISAEGGFHTYLAQMARGQQLKNETQAAAYLARLEQIPRYFTEQTHWLQQGINSGNTVPKAVLIGFEQSIDAFITAPVDNIYYQPFANLSDDFPNRSQWQQRGLDAVTTKVVPSYQRFAAFYQNHYYPAARSSIAASALVDGNDYYANRVRHFTTLNMTAEQVHQLGLTEVARIRSEMAAVIEELDFHGSFAEFLTYLRTDPRFYPQTANELLYYAAHLSKQADAMLPKFFATLPRTPYGVKAVPTEIAPKYTTGRYSGSSGNDQPGYYWVNTYALDKRPLYEMEALTLHEAVPGHHLQISLASELALHPLRRNYYISAFGEGWGLYSEKLGLEGGFYRDPYSNFGRLTYEMWRACRLVVDTGMHAQGWSRQQAIDYLASNTALSLHNVTTEVDRYIGWPGQALSYKIGELTLWRLRHHAEQQLGEDFDIRQFHDQILKGGSLPMTQLEQQINAWIAARQGA